MPNPKHLIHAHSSVVTEGEPKLPAASRIAYGEIAVNFADGHETLSIKNSNDDIVTFSSDEKLYDIIIENERTIATALNDMNDRISDNMDAVDDLETSIENQLDDKLDKMVSITYSSLKSKRDNSQLIPGQMYRITDYLTSTTQPNTASANHQFDIIVTALDVNKLDENARAIIHSGDTYFSSMNANLNAWELKYCLDNDTNRFGWANSNGTGVIYYMKDEWNNECPYDFKNILFVRWGITSVSGSTFSYDILDSSSIAYSYQSGNIVDVNNHITFTTNNNTQSYYTFTIIGDKDEVYDASIFGQQIETTYYDSVIGVHDNIIGICNDKTKTSANKLIMKLNNIVFVHEINSNGSFCAFYGNVFQSQCSDCTLGQGCSNNIFGNDFCENILNGCYSNIFGNTFQKSVLNGGYNSFGNDIRYIYGGYTYCTIHDGVYDIIANNLMAGCTIENLTYDIIISNNYSNDDIENITIKKGIHSTTITHDNSAYGTEYQTNQYRIITL